MYREFTEFQWAMMRLDAALTANSDLEGITHMVTGNRRTSPEQWEPCVEWYLSDGGYSRVVYGEDGKLFLTSNSTDKVKARWSDPRVQGLVNYVERLIREASEGQRG